MKNEPHAIIGFLVRFVFGAAVGLVVGLLWFPGWMWIALGAILFGIAAAMIGDGFWEVFYWWT